jgi:tripartite-type tricarboxylate transporter receptor subunit TctC
MIVLKSDMARKRIETRGRRSLRLCRLALLAALSCVVLGGADRSQAQDWPTRPVRIVIPYGAGGLTDLMARITSARLADILGQPFIIENRPGAMGTIGTQYAISSPNDGYTLYFAAGAQVLAVPHMRKLNYDPLKQLDPVGIVGFNGFVLGVNPALPVKSFSELLAYARANPGKVNYGIAQVGTVSHMLPALLATEQKINIVGVPFSSGPATMTGLIQGSVQMLFGNPSDLLPPGLDGRIRLIAVSSPTRLPQIPDVPTLGETIQGFSFTAWNGYFVPAGTPKPIVDRLSAAIIKLKTDPEVLKRFKEIGITASMTTPEETAAVIKREIPMYEAAVKASGLMRAP